MAHQADTPDFPCQGLILRQFQFYIAQVRLFEWQLRQGRPARTQIQHGQTVFRFHHLYSVWQFQIRQPERGDCPDDVDTRVQALLLKPEKELVKRHKHINQFMTSALFCTFVSPLEYLVIMLDQAELGALCSFFRAAAMNLKGAGKPGEAGEAFWLPLYGASMLTSISTQGSLPDWSDIFR